VQGHVITAQTIDGSKKSLPHVFTVLQGLQGDTADFKYGALQG